MKTIAAAALLVFCAGSAFAQSRPMTPALTCGQARSLVGGNGAIVLGTGRYTYDRYVSSRAFCEINETIEPAWVPTRDVAECPIGYRCVDRDYWDWWD
jgi:hypothetical protein